MAENQQHTDIQVLGRDTIVRLLPNRIKNSHKGTYGRVLNIAGSCQYQGAAYLSSVSSPLSDDAILSSFINGL